ncbi:TraM-binding TraD/TraG-like protein [Larkinella arboricola]|uniref:TraM-binding TraD/TraG-like protein n=1 Tax=Larkinella arboricola TaxID=643671 RepID=A0A327WIU3_LARAB|nr:TraM recognition domain-containing protein [Larkinella arboricola]RAJ89904.1 TraM-binding TraD/TraG-like protein [Larkinella arboricola]
MNASNLNFPLIKFSDDQNDWWRVRHAVEGVQIFGGIGSGKTTGSGKAIAHSFLRNGFGGLVLCTKPGEADLWQGYAKKTGREKDFIFFKEKDRWKFNFLNYEINREGRGANQTINITELFITIFKMGQRISGSNAHESESFWENALKRCLNRTIDLLKLAKEEVTVYNMVKLINHSPEGIDAYNHLVEISDDDKKIQEWAHVNYCIKCLNNAIENVQVNEQPIFDLVYSYFLKEFATIDPRTRNSIKESFLGYCEPFLIGILKDHFSQETTILPEDTFNGKVIVLDFPVKDYLVAGLYAQSIFKHLWQQAVERRKVTKETLPVFLWVDESQYFVNEYDTIFQTTARSSKACTVFLTQNISNYYSQMGGAQISAKVDSLLGNLSTKIFHGNNDAVTNEWASRLIGQTIIALEGGSQQKTMFDINTTYGKSFSKQLMHQILPVEFTNLASGGEYFNYFVEAFITTRGITWSDNNNFWKATFEQDFD